METIKNLFKNKLKSLPLILISFILCALIILNSNYVNKKRAENKLGKEKNLNSFFIDLINKRLLQGNRNILDTKEKKINSNKVCSRSSSELRDYYDKGNLSIIDISDEKIICEEKDKEHMKALFTIVRKYTEDDETNMEEEKENIIKYILHILPFLIFLTISGLSLIGWIICCVCTCGDCFCCCCCKKTGCKNRCFVATYIFYLVTIITCIYVLTKTKNIFVGLADTECSFLRLLQQVSDEEIKSQPKWEGISKVKGLLSDLKHQIINLNDSLLVDQLGIKSKEANNNKTSFEIDIKNFDNNYYNKGNYPSEFTKTFTDISSKDHKNKKYVLDIIKTIGHYDTDINQYPNITFLYDLISEYTDISNKTDEYIQISEKNFNILKTNSTDVIESLNKAEDILNNIEKTFNKIKDNIGEKISEYSISIEDNGKLLFKIVFISLMLISIVLAILLMCICLCSMKTCTSCCLFRCLFKFCVHILWNILALMMILTLLLGSIFSLVGKIGEDTISLIYYVLSEENFNSSNPLLLNEFKDDKNYLNICFYGNGTMEDEFEIGDSFDSIKELDNILNGIENIIQIFKKIKINSRAFISFEEKIKNRTDFINDDFGLMEINKETKDIILKEFLSLLNEEIKKKTSNKELWDINADKNNKCDLVSDSTTENKYHPLTCKPIDREWVKKSTDSNIKDYANIISTIVDLVEKLNKSSLRKDLNDLNVNYTEYLGAYIGVLDCLNISIRNIIGEIKATVGNESLFSFMNIKFIGTNIKIVLKYLKYTLGHDFYNIGIYLIVIGFSLMFSIPSTILLIVIINVFLKENIDNENKLVEENEYLKSRNNNIKNKL